VDKIRVLFLAANPLDTTRLRLGEEVREIETKIRAADYRDSLELVSKWAVRSDDLLQYLNQYRPHIVHFSGHGDCAEELILEDTSGSSKPISKDALVALFTTLKDNIRVVVLNACYSRPQAEAITEQIDCAIGMKRAIGDKAAITFASSFYRAIGFGRSVQEAFDQGKVALQLEGIPEERIPEMLHRTGLDPAEITLIAPSDSTAPGAEEVLAALPDAARKILVTAADGDGTVLVGRSLDGSYVTANRVNLVPEADPRAEAEYRAAVEWLQDNGLLKDTGYKGVVFELTHEGWRLADQLRSGQGTVADPR
jgi:hypothetical protein